jgi:hypothetical protein
MPVKAITREEFRKTEGVEFDQLDRINELYRESNRQTRFDEIEEFRPRKRVRVARWIQRVVFQCRTCKTYIHRDRERGKLPVVRCCGTVSKFVDCYKQPILKGAL